MRQTSTQKKNNMRSMIIVALLLLLVAVIGFGGYTLSKFVSEKSEAGTAQVAKWGYTLDANAEKLFGANYEFATNESVVSTSTGTAGFTVSASNADTKLVAPGTTGFMTFSVKGTAEVKAALDIKFDYTSDVVLKYTKGGVDGTYNPVVWTLTRQDANSTTTVANGTLAEIKDKLNGTTDTYEVKADVDVVYTLSWAWAFGTEEVTENDHLDTILGMMANGTAADKAVSGDYAAVADGTSTTISFTLKMSVVQLAK